MATNLLFLEDVINLGRSGDLVSVKPGFARNFLVPQRKAVVADANTIKMQARLMAEREKQAALDRDEAHTQASHIEGITLSINVKVDPEGHMYGSVSAAEILKLLGESGIELEKSAIQLKHPVKTTGVHTISLRLKEGVETSCKLKVLAEGQVLKEEQGEAEEQPSEEIDSDEANSEDPTSEENT